MQKIPTFLHFRNRFPQFPPKSRRYSRQEGQVCFAYLWNFRTVGTMRLQW
jgi:hypothetical protein